MMKKEIKDDSYFVIRGYMVNELKLKKSELLVYAIVNSFTEKGKTYSGSLSYLASWINGSRTTANNVLKSLTKKGLLNKTEKIVNNVKFCEYTVNRTPKKKEEEECSKNDTPDQKQNSGKKTDTGECNNFCDGISKNDTGSQKIEPGCIKNCTGGVSISDTGYAKNCTGGIPISEPNKELDTSSNNKFDKESEKESDNQENEDSISINIDSPISETQYRNLEKDISQNLKLVFRFRNIPEDYFSVCDANPEEELNEILKYFFRKYNSFSRDEKIFTISYEETMQVVKEYFVTEGILFEDSVFRFGDYKEMIDLYFTKHIRNDMEHNLSNFMNETFRKFLYEEIKEKRKDATGTSYYTAPPYGNRDDAPLPFN